MCAYGEIAKIQQEEKTGRNEEAARYLDVRAFVKLSSMA